MDFDGLRALALYNFLYVLQNIFVRISVTFLESLYWSTGQKPSSSACERHRVVSDVVAKSKISLDFFLIFFEDD